MTRSPTRITVTNNGPSDTDGPITLEDTVPTGMTYDSVSGDGWTCSVEARIVTCDHEDGIVDGGSLTLALTFDVGSRCRPGRRRTTS